MNSTRVADFRLQDWLPAKLPPDTVIAVLAALTVLVVFLAVWMALRSYNPFERRYAQIVYRKEALRQAALQTRRQRQPLTAAGFMQSAVQNLNLMRSRQGSDARLLLARAGMRSRDAMVRYLFARITLPSLFAMVVLLDSYGPHLLMIPTSFRFIAALAAAAFGYIAPGLYIKNVAAKRAHRMQLALPDALDLMVICAEAGLSLDAALTRVSRELEPSHPDLGEEFGITAAELTFLPDRRQAFDNLNNRTNLSSIRGVVNTLLQTARFGTPLAYSLRVLASEYREARITKAEEKAARLPAMLTVPMILFILPTLFIILLGPAALGIMDTFSKNGSQQKSTIVGNSDSGSDGIPEVGKAEFIDKPAAPSEPELRPRISVLQKQVGITDMITVDVDARALASGFQHRIVVLPAYDSEEISSATARDGVTVQAAQVRVMVPPYGPGRNEVRLYYIPPYGSDYVVAARATVDVTGGATGATPVSRLLLEASSIGNSAFVSKYRGRKLTVEGQILRSDRYTAGDLAAFPALRGAIDPGRSYIALALGTNDAATASSAGPTELRCLMPADDGSARGAEQATKALVVEGSVIGAGEVLGGNAIVLGNCKPR